MYCPSSCIPSRPCHSGIWSGFTCRTWLFSSSSCVEQSLYPCFACLVFLDIGSFEEVRLVFLESLCLDAVHWNVTFPPWRRKWQPTPVFLPEKSYGQRSLAGLQSMGLQGSVTTWRLNHQPPLPRLFFVPSFPLKCLLTDFSGFLSSLFIFTSFCLSGLQFFLWKKLLIIFPDLTSHSYSLLPLIIC